MSTDTTSGIKLRRESDLLEANLMFFGLGENLCTGKLEFFISIPPEPSIL
jgi:hypothetical protein